MQNKKVVIIGGGIVGCETAMFLASNNNQVTILEMTEEYAKGLETFHKFVLPFELENAKINMCTEVVTKEIVNHGIHYTSADGKEQFVEADLVVMATGQKSTGAELAEEIVTYGIPVHVIGDARKVGKIKDAIRDGFRVAYNL